MPWSKLDDEFYDHPKTAEAGTMAVGLFALALSYTAKKLTDGYIPASVIKKLASDVDDPMRLADRLVQVGLFEEVDGGYQIHDYLDYNPPAYKVKEKREEAKQRMREQRAQQERGENGQYQSKECSREHDANLERTDEQVTPSPVPRTPYPVSRDPSPGARTLGAGVAAPAGPEPPAESEPSKKRARSPHDEVRLALEVHFAETTGLPRPESATDKQKKSAASLWWQPLRDIAELCAWDVGESTRLIDAAVAQLKGRCTIASPKSILATALAIKTGNAGGNGKPRASPAPAQGAVSNMDRLRRWAEKEGVIGGDKT